jgi:hypothetical protein
MNLRLSIISLGLLASIPAHGQAPVTITAADMFNEMGLYYRAYANSFDPSDPTTSFSTLLPTGEYVMGSAGTNQFWDFTTGPTNQVFRFDYLATTNIAEAADFPNATIAEQKTVEGTNETSWLFFTQVPGVGRKVYGFYDPQFSPDTPSNVFSSPIVDFPGQIKFGDTWTTSMTFTTLVAVLDFGSYPVQLTYSSTFTVDAWGVIYLPQLSFDDALRVNEDQTIASAVDLDGTGQFQPLETDYTRNYYWLRPGHGIVAQLNSVQYSTPPPDNFDQATAFIRMFETNKKASAGGTNAAPVTDLGISIGTGGRVLLKWTKAQSATQYRVEYTTDPSKSASWQPLGTSANNFLLDTNASQDQVQMRFYRVVSLK